MKWTLRQLEDALKKPATQLPPVALIYGDDSGAVRQASQKLIKHTGIDIDDPFVSSRLDIQDIANEPAKLLDAAGTVSLMGGMRLVKVEGVNGDLPANTLTSLANAVKSCLEGTLQDVVIIIPAPRVSKDSSLAKAVEKDKKQAAAIRCFQDNIRDIRTYIQNHAQAEHKKIQPDALALLAENLGADRDITHQELQKLITYVGEADQITREDATACLADAPAANIFKLCDAVGARDTKTVDRLLNILMEEGEDPNMLFTMVVRHLRRVLEAKEAMAGGLSENDALRTLSPPVMFGQREFIMQMSRMPLPRLRQVVKRALDLQYQTRNEALPPELHLRRGILALAV